MKKNEYIPRDLRGEITRALTLFPVVVVSGPRQAGKSTMIQEESGLAGREYFTLDDLTLLGTAQRDPESLLAASDLVTIDEAQRAPELFLAVKKLVDREKRPGRFLLSGSANFLLLQNLADSLAGRAVYLNLMPFSAREIERSTHAVPFLKQIMSGSSPLKAGKNRRTDFQRDRILRGGFPPAHLMPGDGYRDWFRAYEQTYLERDVRQLTQVGDLNAFRTLLHLAALRTGQVLNQSEIGRDAGLNAVTAGRYLSLLETSCIAHRVPSYHSSRTKQLVKAPKLVMADSGLAAFLCGIESFSPENDHLKGALLETYAAQNIISVIGAHLPGARLFYWRMRRGPEVDFVIESDRGILAIEIKGASKISTRDTKGLRVFAESHSRCLAGLLGYMGADIVPLGEKIWAAPLSVLWS